ncbi:RSPH1 [Symbiodinium pilosum]|uniref:RSPH1 protein n=1 Tax=Symbiodinium pilosum TaxID=2952 RepID=A0A812J390_SYMPI|nr:RSPH1 [Symbiodinium pilosum]
MDYCPDARCRETEVSEFLLDNTQEGAQTPCPQLHFAPRLRAKWESEWSLARPAALHDDEWARGPAGQIRLRQPLTILLSLPNSGTTWIMSVLEEATKNKGCVAGNSDILHPNCNGLLMKEISKVAGAPDHDSWRNIFDSPVPAAMDLLLELATDQLNVKALAEVQAMRVSGYTAGGEALPEELVWPWKGLVPRRLDVTRVRLLLTKEIINVYQVSKHLEWRQRSGQRPAVTAFALYRHRAHCFPMSNSSAALCKECWYQQILHAFELADFSDDVVMRGLQRWWLSRKHLVGGRSGPSGLVFAHLVAWFPLLRAQPFGLCVLDYAQLMLLDRVKLHQYLNQTLPGNLLRNPGAEIMTRSFIVQRFANPPAFFAKRESSYYKLGAEPFARAAIAEMRRLDPRTDFSLLEPPRTQAWIQEGAPIDNVNIICIIGLQDQSMADEPEEGEPKYQYVWLFVRGAEKPREALYLTGDSYEGTFVEGKGLYVFKKTGDSYEGKYEENRKHGFGKMTYRNNVGEDEEGDPPDENAPPRGGTYLGNFTAGLRGCLANAGPEAPADGTFTYVNGDAYAGQWREGKKHGKGTYTFAKDGTQLVGEWEDGKIVSGKWVFPNGTFYCGKFRYNKPYGKGVWVFKNGNQLAGDYLQKEQATEDEPADDAEAC